MSQHTPGPWQAKPYSGKSGPRFYIQAGDSQPFLADIYDGNSSYPAQANAHLISKAPEMLTIIRGMFEREGWEQHIENARVLLREIEGEQE